MKNILSNNYLLVITRVILALVFIFAAAGKISNPEDFAVSISNYRVFPTALLNIVAITLPWIEFTTALFLLFGINVKEGSVILSCLLVVFIAMVGIALFRGLDINCGCFGTMDAQRVGLTKILENFILLSFGVHIILFYDKKNAIFRIQ